MTGTSDEGASALELARRIRAAAAAAGAAAVGVCGVDPFDDVAASLQERVDAGYAGSMSFTFSQPGRSTDIRASFPWASSLVVVGWPYLPRAGAPGPARPGAGRIARFSTEDHYQPLRTLLDEVAVILRTAGHRAEALADDNRLVDRAAAVRAGLGWWGKNTMVLAPRWGPWLLFGSVVTDALMDVSQPMVRDCGTCAACLPACPTGALVAPGVMDATKCLAYVLQSADPIPPALRTAIGDRFYGCDDCLDACPPGVRLAEESAAAIRGRVDLRWVLTASDPDLLHAFSRFYIPRRQPRYLRRNALIALGNSGDAENEGLLARYLDHDDPLLRSMAAWALGALAADGGRNRLQARRVIEADPEVMAEIELALEGASPVGDAPL